MKEFYSEQFNSIDEFLSVIHKRPLNQVFRQRADDLPSQKDREDWNGSTSYQESVELLKNGYKEGLEQMKAVNTRITHRGYTNRRLPTANVVGFSPHVPNAIAGIPKSMIDYKTTPQKDKVITILYNTGVNYSISTDTIIKAGKNMLDVIETLETQGYRVGLHTILGSTKDQCICFTCIIKHWRQPINPLKISYPFVHPSWLRRQGLKWIETNPNLTDDRFLYNCGTPIQQEIGDELSDRQNFFIEKGLMKKNWYYMESEEAAKYTPEQLIEIMWIK